MAAARRSADAAIDSVLEALLQEPHRFDFFQAVRVLERHARLAGKKNDRPVGYDYAPSREPVRFGAHPSLSFPSDEIVKVAPASESRGDAPLEMIVSFLGLTGPSGVLPDHYTTILMERIRANDFALQKFFDLFNHRLISLFYRAWEKSNQAASYDRSRMESGVEDAFTAALLGITGTPERKLDIDFEREVFLCYGGLFASSSRSAASLEAMLAEQFQAPMKVKQFQGEWLRLPEEDQSRLPGANSSQQAHARLGVDVILCDRIWHVQGRFKVVVGPVNWRQFRSFLPDGEALRPLCQFVRAYVGAELSFDVQVLLDARQAAYCQLATGDKQEFRLGWNTWLQSDPSVSVKKVLDEAVFDTDAVLGVI